MASRTSRPQISTQGGRHIIFVPGNKAAALRQYLQARGVRSTPPEAVTAQTSSLELGPRDDLQHVQTLLKSWNT